MSGTGPCRAGRLDEVDLWRQKLSKKDISINGHEANYTTWWLAKMNLSIRGIDGQIAHGIR